MFLKAMELYEDGTKQWADSTGAAFDLLRHDECDGVPKPEWWNDEALKALSARVVAVAPDAGTPCTMRAYVLASEVIFKHNWNAAPRTAMEIKEAVMWFRRAAKVQHTPAAKLSNETLASQCDAVADSLLAKEEAECGQGPRCRRGRGREDPRCGQGGGGGGPKGGRGQGDSGSQGASRRGGEGEEAGGQQNGQ